MTAKLNYTREEIFAEYEFASHVKIGDYLFHGGLDAEGNYLSPRSLHRIPAIKAWTQRLKDAGHTTTVFTADDLPMTFFPNTEQSKLLLHHGCKDAMARTLTMVGTIEGYGNAGIALFPQEDLQKYFVEDIEDTCLAHLQYLLPAHGHDEAFSDYKGYKESGHEEMWWVIRDVCLDYPEITDDMFEDLPIPPPPGYQGRAKAAPDALNIAEAIPLAMTPGVPPVLEFMVTGLTSLLAIEFAAASTFKWAKEVLGDPECSSDPEFAVKWVNAISADETIHVTSLQCALSELSTLTILGTEGQHIPGKPVLEAAVKRTIASQQGDRFDRVLAHRMKYIKRELDARPDGEKILAEFAELGPVPEFVA